MILAFAAKGKKTIACVMLALIYLEAVVPAYALGSRRTVYRVGAGVPAVKPVAVMPVADPAKVSPRPAPLPAKAASAMPPKGTGGPTQPEMETFHSVNSDNMVDLFSGNFAYNIPLLDVDGYPLSLGYSSGITMDQEASWTGLGWNINPGTITRNVRGLPDDFNGSDQITKRMNIKENKTSGGTGGATFELFGLDLKSLGASADFSLSASVGVFKNTYRGWGMEASISPSIGVSAKGAGSLTAGLGLGMNSQEEGLSISPSLDVTLSQKDSDVKNVYSGKISTSLTFNTRSGLKALQYSGGVSKYRTYYKKSLIEGIPRYGRFTTKENLFSASISYAYPGSIPAMSIPYTSEMYTGKFALGGEVNGLHPQGFASGYQVRQYIADADKTLTLPAFGYLYYYNGAGNVNALMDYNREREMPIKEGIKNIAIPAYTSDVFSISGEGTGGMFRAYRNDIGYVYDHFMSTKSTSASLGAEVGLGNAWHAGVDLTETHSTTVNGAWVENNPLAKDIAFTASKKQYEAVHFRNPGEMTAQPKTYYEMLGGDDVVFAEMTGNNTPNISTTDNLWRYKGGKLIGKLPFNNINAANQERSKRTQVISYLTAEEASLTGLSKLIENYGENQYVFNNCVTYFSGAPEGKHGYIRENFQNEWFGEENGGRRNTMIAPSIYHPKGEDDPDALTNGTGFSNVNHLSCRWTGKLKAPATGVYYFDYKVDDGVRITINGKRFTPDKDWDYNKDIPKPIQSGFNVNLEKDNTYDIVVEYYNATRSAVMIMNVYYGNKSVVPNDIYQPIKVFSYTIIPGKLTKEERMDSIRKPHHLSEIDVLNNDGKKYVYGLPVYNLKEKEVTFSVKHENGNAEEGTVSYNAVSTPNNPREDDVTNSSGNDHYFVSEETPAYAHSFLLTGVVSPDYVDLTGDGITDDDAGNAVKFNYTKTAGQGNPYKWRTPYTRNATYSEGFKTENYDDKGSYVYGEKELWYLNSIESKNMVATFTLEDREDLLPIDEQGNKIRNTHQAKRLKEINLYVKADYMKSATAAKPVKTVHFEYSYELCPGVNAPESDSGKLTLKKVWFSYNGNESKNNPKRAQQNAYVFNYNKLNPAYAAKSYDRWGEYKPASQNPMGSDGKPMTNPEYPYALQDSALAAANVGAWTLDSIKLPSGGRIKVIYEGDDYAYVQNRRAAKMINIAGFSDRAPGAVGDLSNHLYERGLDWKYDNLYVAFNVPRRVTSKEEVRSRYLSELHDTLFFRLNVKMPSDDFGSGNEYVPCYGFIDQSDYGFIAGTNIIYVKLRAVNKKGNEGGDFSPLAQAAMHFLRLNLPSKAFPGSNTGENLDMGEAIKMVVNMATGALKQLISFDRNARKDGWAQEVDLSRSYARLNDPYYKKYGGGLRVKKLLIYDHWNKMTGKKESVYGTEYKYTTVKKIDGKDEEISSGVAIYEPILGGEENPFHTPNIYSEQAGHLAPVFTSYVENPLGEGFFPAPSVGYAKVTTRSINTKNTRSANGSEETCFYTAYEFPTIVETSELGDESKFRYKPGFQNFLKIDAKYHMAITQGFKIELNDMHGKVRSKSTFAESGKDPIASTTYYYRVDNDSSEIKHLRNTVTTINAKGEIDTAAIVGKNIELMMDMRQQTFRTHSSDRSINTDGFVIGVYLIYIPVYFGYPRNEENIFKSVATTKVINRQGILDRIEVVDKGSKVITRNLLYDSETGEVLLTATQNEFGDSIYQFSYPAAWAYDGMGGAYKNIQTTVAGVNIRNGKIISGLSAAEQNELFVSGDEMLIYSRNRVYGDPCIGDPAGLATFPSNSKIWAVDANALNGNTPDIYFLTKEGKPFTGEDVTLKVITSGRKNLNTSVGSVTMMKTPLVKNGNNYELVIDKTRNIINASVTEFKQNWHVEDVMKSVKECVY
ncbi:MAG: hypothetical protein J7623_15930 [Chitinophaga sp.]|uniref:PA14 domain-containing protein n=1 Tax=Chitinophaga sp. TaxID=1869181 RepID=UPI001B19AC04|nr:PA14 domain-containing protein [Chitinophaga sp.]MBO9730128.1 hypothetical protein [Chitinophaga sp.]